VANKIWAPQELSQTEISEVTSTKSGSKNGMDAVIISPVETTSAIYATIIDEPSSSTTYVGVAETGSDESLAVWQIKKISVSGAVTKITWADGNSDFDNVWADRASLTYS
jgi:hypothetical protein